MTNKFTRQYRGFVAWRGGLAGLAIAGVLGGCSGPMPRSVATLAPADRGTLERVGDTIIEDSRHLAEQQKRLAEGIARTEAAARALAPVAPVYDPLENKVVTINMYDTEVGHLLWALADQLGMNLIVDPQVIAQPQRASLYLKNVTAREVYNHILRIFDLHGETRGGALVVNLMEERVFDLDLLNTTMSIDVSAGGNVFGSGGGASGGGNGGGASGGGGNQLRGNFILNGNTNKQVDPYDQVEQAVARILGAEGEKGGVRDAQEDRTRTTFALNHMTGSLYVRARPSQVASIDKLVDRVQTVMHRQVQVEAQLIDVQLNDGFQFGVDWNLLRDHVAGVYGNSPLTLGSAESPFPGREGILIPPRTLTLPAQTIGSALGRGAGLVYGQDSFSVALSALRSFGNVKVLSNPSVRVRNGTPAMLSVGTNTRYVAKSAVTIDTLAANSLRTADVQTDSLFSGIIVGVVPFIHEDGRVELLVHPMQTEVDQASLALVDAGGGSRVTLPVVNYKGITTTLNLNNGDTVLIGGLIDQKTASTNRGLPGASDVPVLGNLFDDRQKQHASRELVVVLRAHVL